MELHKTLKEMGRVQDKLDSVAGGILAAIRDQHLDTLEAFNDAVKDAYAANGWNVSTGRPPKGSKVKPAPTVLQTYLSTVRAAYRFDLDPGEYTAWRQLREAVKESRDAQRKEPEPTLPELRGLKIESDDRLTGSLLHDVVVVYEHAPETTRERMQRRLKRMLTEFQRDVESSLKVA